MVARVKKIPVPDVTGLAVPIAEKVARAAGLAGVQVRYVESYEPANTVIAQEPSRGSLLDADQRILAQVSKTSLIRYLPTVYQPRVPGDRAFLREYLWIFQHLFDGITSRLESVPDLMNPYTTPPDFLPWLASWFAISFDESMSEAARRRVLREATVLYRVRGTRAAIVKMVKLFSGLDVEIVENQWPYKGFRVGVSASIGVDTMILPEVSMSQTFVVKLPVSFEQIGADALIRLHQVIEAEKPASTNYFLQFQDQEGVSEYAGFMQIGVASIGVEEEEGPAETPEAPLPS